MKKSKLKKEYIKYKNTCAYLTDRCTELNDRLSTVRSQRDDDTIERIRDQYAQETEAHSKTKESLTTVSISTVLVIILMSIYIFNKGT